MSSGTKLVLVLVLLLFVGTGIYVAFVAPPAKAGAGTSGAPNVTGGSNTPSASRPTAPAVGGSRTSPAQPVQQPQVTPPGPPNAPKPMTPAVPGEVPRPAPRGAIDDPLARGAERPTVPAAGPQTGGKGDAPDGASTPPSPGTVQPGGSTVTPIQPGGSQPPTSGTNPATAPSGPPSAPPAAGGTPGGPRPSQPVGPTPVAPKPATPLERTHTVASGETMSVIAEKYYGDKNKWTILAKANPLIDPAGMKVGTKLVVPPAPTAPAELPRTAGGRGTPAPANAPPPAAANGATTHTVAAGDTLAALARKYYGNTGLWEEIYEANRATIGADPEALKVGMKLVIPKRG